MKFQYSLPFPHVFLWAYSIRTLKKQKDSFKAEMNGGNIWKTNGGFFFFIRVHYQYYHLSFSSGNKEEFNHGCIDSDTHCCRFPILHLSAQLNFFEGTGTHFTWTHVHFGQHSIPSLTLPASGIGISKWLSVYQKAIY